MSGPLLGMLLLAKPAPAAPAAVDGEEVAEELATVEAVDEAAAWYGPSYGQADRGLDLFTARVAHPESFVFAVTHRNRQPLARDPLHSFLGFDGGGLKIGLGLRYGILDGLDAGIFRQNGTVETFDTYELDLRYQLLSQERYPLDLALRGGVTWFAVAHGEDALAYFGQLLADRVFANRFLAGAGLLFHSDSSSDRKAVTALDPSLALALLAEARLLEWLALTGESSWNVAGYGQRYPTLSLAVKLVTHRHTFAIAVSNTQYVTADGVVANSRRGRAGQLVLGFNITREL
jgi:hypothetical protein